MSLSRLLLMLGDEELLKPPYSIENPAHRRAVLAELDRVRTLGVKPPQNLWEYKVRNQQCGWLCSVSALLCLLNGFVINRFRLASTQ